MSEKGCQHSVVRSRRELRQWLAARHRHPLGVLSVLVALGTFWSWLLVMPHPEDGWTILITGCPGAFLVAIAFAFAVERLVLAWLARGFTRLPICGVCGYELTFDDEAPATVQCPECGTLQQSKAR